MVWSAGLSLFCFCLTGTQSSIRTLASHGVPHLLLQVPFLGLVAWLLLPAEEDLNCILAQTVKSQAALTWPMAM